MDYLKKVLGVQVIETDEALPSFPAYIYDRYQLKRVKLDKVDAVFVCPKDKLSSIDAVEKHLSRIEKATKVPAVLKLDKLTYHQKEYLIKERIPFIVEGKQIYLPFLAVYLQERCQAEIPKTSNILPSAQLLLLHYIYNGCGEMLMSDASRELCLTATSISRASRQLEDLGLVKSKRKGNQKIIFSSHTPKELFKIAKSSLVNPVKRTVYVPKDVITKDLLYSSYTALSNYSQLNPPKIKYYATSEVTRWSKNSTNSLLDSNFQVALDLWRYDPRKLSKSKNVDKLSLALALSDDKDERVEEAVEEMLNQVWLEIDKRKRQT